MPRREDRRRVDRMLLEVTRTISSSLDLDRVTDLILKELVRMLDADHASLFLMDEESKRLVLSKARGFTRDGFENLKIVEGWELINEHLVKRKKSLLVNDVRTNRTLKKIFPAHPVAIHMHSFLAVPLLRERDVIGALMVSNVKRPGHVFTKDDEKLLTTMSHYISITLFNAKLYHNLKNFFIHTVMSLMKAVDAKDPYTSGHSERVMRYSLAIGDELKLDTEAMENLKLSGLLHDVGKIGIKERVLDKTGTLSSYERKEIYRHPQIGAGIVEKIDNSHRILRGIIEHHERFDGKGYPNHLKGPAISLEGRIIAVADTFDALTSDRTYHKRFSVPDALAEIEKGSGTQFDPRIVEAFKRSFVNHPEIWNV